MWIWSEGSWIEGEISLPPFVPVVYESVRTYGGEPFKLEEHFMRLRRSASLVNLEVPRLSEVENAISSFESKSDVRFRVFLSPSGLMLSAEEITEHPGSVSVVISRWRKPPKSSIPPHLKIVNNPSTLLARLEKGRAYEALMLNSEGFLAEGTFSNVFLVREGRVVTPSLDTGILDGITRKIVMDLARELGYGVEERLVEIHEVFTADEVFLTHTSAEIVPVKGVNGFRFDSPGPITRELMENFRRFAL